MKNNVKQASEYYLSEFRRRFPEAALEVGEHAIDGSDVWIRILVDEGDVLDAVELAAMLDGQVLDRFGVGVLPSVHSRQNGAEEAA